MSTRVALNGFGRTGRALYRALLQRGAEIEVVAINDGAPARTLATLLARDSIYGPLRHEVKGGDDHICVDGHEIPVFSQKETPTVSPS